MARTTKPRTPIKVKTVDTQWMKQAACAGVSLLDEDNCPEDYVRVPTAKMMSLCVSCPVKVQCLEFGMDEMYGVYGGTTPFQRRQLNRTAHRSMCPGCGSGEVVEEGSGEVCISCGISWLT